MANIIITGSKGLIGSHLTKLFKNKNFSYINFSKLNRNFSSSQNINYFSNINIKANYDTLVHLGWCQKLNLFSKKKLIESNIKNTQLLFKIANSLKIKKFVFMSTALVYGEKNHEIEIKSKSNLEPNSFYGFQKKEVEEMLLKLGKTNKIQIIIIRIPLVISKKSKSLLNKYNKLLKIFNGECFNNFHNKRSYISEENLIKNLQLIIEDTDFNKNKIINLFDAPPLSLFEISKIIQKIERRSNIFEKTFGFFIGLIFNFISKAFLKNKINNNFVLSAANQEFKISQGTDIRKKIADTF